MCALPIANPITPVTVMLNQKNAETSLSLLSIITCTGTVHTHNANAVSSIISIAQISITSGNIKCGYLHNRNKKTFHIYEELSSCDRQTYLIFKQKDERNEQQRGVQIIIEKQQRFVIIHHRQHPGGKNAV